MYRARPPRANSTSVTVELESQYCRYQNPGRRPGSAAAAAGSYPDKQYNQERERLRAGECLNPAANPAAQVSGSDRESAPAI